MDVVWSWSEQAWSVSKEYRLKEAVKTKRDEYLCHCLLPFKGFYLPNMHHSYWFNRSQRQTVSDLGNSGVDEPEVSWRLSSHLPVVTQATDHITDPLCLTGGRLWLFDSNLSALPPSFFFSGKHLRRTTPPPTGLIVGLKQKLVFVDSMVFSKLLWTLFYYNFTLAQSPVEC